MVKIYGEYTRGYVGIGNKRFSIKIINLLGENKVSVSMATSITMKPQEGGDLSFRTHNIQSRTANLLYIACPMSIPDLEVLL